MTDALCSFCWADVPKEARIVYYILLSLYNPLTSRSIKYIKKKPLPKKQCFKPEFIARV